MRGAGNSSYQIAGVARLGMENAGEVDLSANDAMTEHAKRARDGVIVFDERLSQHTIKLLRSLKTSTFQTRVCPGGKCWNTDSVVTSGCVTFSRSPPCLLKML